MKIKEIDDLNLRPDAALVKRDARRSRAGKEIKDTTSKVCEEQHNAETKSNMSLKKNLIKRLRGKQNTFANLCAMAGHGVVAVFRSSGHGDF